MGERWVRRVIELSVVPAISCDEPGMAREFPPELYEGFENGKQALVSGEKAFLALRGPVDRDGKKVFVVAKITLEKTST